MLFEWRLKNVPEKARNSRTAAVTCVLGIAGSVVALAPALAQTAGPLVQITTDDPFAKCTADNVAQQEKSIGSTLFPNTAIEPWVAIDPTTQNLLVGHQQDRWSDGGSRGLVGNLSTDGGAHWSETIPIDVSECTGGTFARASDPWVTFSPINGHAFFSSLVSNPSSTPFFGVSGGGQLVSRSKDGGATWEAPITLITDGANVLNDKNSITADPLDENFVFTVWDRLVLGASNGAVDGVSMAQSRLPRTPASAIGPHPSRGPTLLSRTTNGGDSWETPRVIFDPGVDSQTINNQTVVLPNGDVLVFFSELLSSGVNNIAFVRSTDKGFTFDATPTIATDIEVVRTVTPDELALVRDASILFSVNVNPNVNLPTGALYLVWQDCRFMPHDCTSGTPVDGIAFSQSLDGGKTWSAPMMINKTPQDLSNPLRQQAFIPAITSAGDGTLAVTYYDFRHDTDAAGEELTDYFAVFCTPSAKVSCADPANWGNELQLTSGSITSFNILDAPNADGHFLGDYMGLVASGLNVWPVFGAVTGHNLTADFTSKITLPTKMASKH